MNVILIEPEDEADMKKRAGCITMTFIMILFLAVPILPTVSAASFNDVRGHWAEGYIIDVVNRGIVRGYTDGSFRPNDAVTRAEFVSMINNTLGNRAMGNVYFSDVSYNSWYYNEVRKAVAAAYVSINDNGSFRPNDKITREEAAVIISRIVPTYGVKGALRGYKDANSVSDWAKQAIEKVTGKGYLGAYDDGKLHPKDSLTRAQTAKIICSISSGERIEMNNKVIRSASEKLSDTIYSNGIEITKDLGNGDATITNCVVLGTFGIYGGGLNTVTVTNSRVADCTIAKTNTPVRLLVTGESDFASAYAYEVGTIETSKLSGGLYGPGFEKLDIKEYADITLKGNFPEVNTAGNNATIRHESGTIDVLNVQSNGKYCHIYSQKTAKILKADVRSPASFHGKGVVSDMYINSNGVTYETKPTRWTLGSDGRSPDYTEAGLNVTFSPRDGANNVDTNSNITLTFNDVVYNADGKKISTADVTNAVEFRRRYSSGNQVDYTVTIDSSKKTITLIPKYTLAEDTRYYVTIIKNRFKNIEGKYLAEETTSFYTGDSPSGLYATFYPRNGSTGVSLNTDPTITFSEAVSAYTGKPLDTPYIESKIIFKEGGASGTDVKYDAELNTSKTRFSLYPKEKLKDNVEYYIGIPDKAFITETGNATIPAGGSTFTTSTVSPGLSGISVTPTDSTLTASITPSIDGTVYMVLLENGIGAPSTAQIIAGQDGNGNKALASGNIAGKAGTSISFPTFTGLRASTTYNMYAVLKTDKTTSGISSRSASTAAYVPPESMVNNIVVSGVASGFFSPTIKSYDLKVPYGTTSTTVTVAPVAGSTVMYEEGIPGSSYQLYNIPINVNLNPGTTTVIRIKSMEDKKSHTVYTLNIKVAGNTDINNVEVTAVSPLGVGSWTKSGDVIIVPKNASGASIQIDVADSNATITCSQLTNTNSSVPGTLTGDVNLINKTTNLSITVTSNSEAKTYTNWSILKAD